MCRHSHAYRGRLARRRSTGRRIGLVRQVAEACRFAGRGSDIFGRLDSNQIGVIAPGADAAGVECLIDRIAAALDSAGRSRRGLRVGVFAVPDARTSTISVPEMLAQAASRT